MDASAYESPSPIGISLQSVDEIAYPQLRGLVPPVLLKGHLDCGRMERGTLLLFQPQIRPRVSGLPIRIGTSRIDKLGYILAAPQFVVAHLKHSVGNEQLRKSSPVSSVRTRAKRGVKSFDHFSKSNMPAPL
jgi:hypothetical protein